MERTVKFTIYGKPFAKQRPRVMKTGFAFTPKETVNYETLIKHTYSSEFGTTYLEGPLKMKVIAYFEIPKSTPKKNIPLMVDGSIRHTKKPDWDNLGKIVSDALNGVAYHDDSYIVDANVTKFYSVQPRVEIEISEMI